MYLHEDIRMMKPSMQPKDDYIQLASLFKLFGDGTRVQILHALEQSEMCMWSCCATVTNCNLTPVKGIASCEFGKSPEKRMIALRIADDHVKEIIDKGFEHLWQK